MRVIEEFGKIISLSSGVFSRVGAFMMYFMMYIVVFSFTYGVLGLTIDKDDDHT